MSNEMYNGTCRQANVAAYFSAACIAFAACSPMKKSNTGQSMTGLCASARPGESTIPMPLPPPPSVERSEQWTCPYPVDADKEGIDAAETSIQVLIGPDGTARDVRILADPGYGFATAATHCAYAHIFTPARDGNGNVVPAWTPPICVHFSR
jgi:hypothetical protein